MNYALILQFIILSFLSCENEENKTDVPVKFEYNILDQDGVPSTELKEGKNFMFSFLIINESDSKLYFNPPIVDENWFNVFKVGSDFKDKPFDSICLGLIKTLVIDVKDTFEISIPWEPELDKSYWPFCQKSHSSTLTSGDYYSSFDQQFEFKTADKDYSYITEELTFKINFKIIK